MDKTIVGLIAAIGSIATMAAAQAAVTPDAVDRAMSASSFALQSGPNAPAIPRAAKISGLRRPKTAKCKSRSIMGMGMGTIPMGMGMVVVMGMGMAIPTMGMVGMGMGMIWWVWVWWVPSWVGGMGTAGTTTTTESHGFALAARSM